jgi:very-short-patch-repair endonuclease
MALEHDRLLSLIQYAQQAAALKGAPVCDVARHNIFHEYEHSLQGLPGLHFNEGEENDEIWLSVERVHESHPPKPSSPLLEIWLEVSNHPTKEPALKQGVELAKLLEMKLAVLEENHDPLDIKRLVLLLDFDHKAEVEAQFKSYLKTKWEPWSVEEKKRRRTIQLYGKLFTLKQHLEGAILDAQVEVVWGVGLSVWNMDGVNISYPLITQLVDVTVNEKTLAIEIRPREMDARLELDIYTAVNNSGTSDLEKAYKDFCTKSTQTFSPFDSGTYDGVLRSAVASLHSKGVYWPAQTTADDRKLPPASEELKVTDTWVLYARPRSKNLFVQDLERFKKDLEQEGIDITLPRAIMAVLKEPSNSNEHITLPSFRGISMVRGHDDAADTSSAGVADLYFPMPFNDEQVRIVQMLERHEGVVVQGPPGTGKTHTIANIISHYFALGKRVLVTSMKEPALAVLRDKLPEEIRPLAISLLSNEQEGMKQFEHAISKIASEIQTIDTYTLKNQIRHLESTVDALHGRLAKIDRDIASWAKKNLDNILFDGEDVSPIAAATEVVKGEGHYEWLEDKISLPNAAQFDDSDIACLRHARRLVANDINYIDTPLPEITAFPTFTDLLRIHQDLSRHAELEQAIDVGDIPPLVNSTDEVAFETTALLDKVNSLISLVDEITCAEMAWTSSARRVLQQKTEIVNPIVEIFDALGQEIKAALEQRAVFIAKPVALPTDIDLDEEIVKAIENIIAGKSPFGLGGLIGKGDAKKRLNEIRLLSKEPETVEDWMHVHACIFLHRRFRELVARWNSVAPELAVESFDVIAPNHAIRAGERHAIHTLVRRQMDWEQQVSAKAQDILPTWGRHADLKDNLSCMKALQAILEKHTLRYRLAAAWSNKEELQKLLSAYGGKISEDLKTFIIQKLGNPKITDAVMQGEWSSLIEELKRLHGLRSGFADIKDVCGKIESSGASKWAEKLRTNPLTNTVDTLLPDEWKKAWRLRRLASYLEAADGRNDLKSLAKQRKDSETDLAKAYRNIVAQRTWLKLCENATPDIRSALAAFHAAIAKIGKGTGKRAIRYRQDARHAASRANRAVPCWIMAHWRVSESLPPELGCFDLVIIDEASQSDLSALPALLRAKKILIVGDDKQVSPDGVGLEEDKIRNLMSRYLVNQVEDYRAQMTPERSMYDLFKVVFARSSTMLREHFRCVSPIVEYSKREFYNHELKPVRIPRSSERLDPPLIDVLVEDGHRKGDLNVPEARFIVDEIKKICDDPALQNRTIGIVSLLADKQALKIWEMLEIELGPEKIERHHIACGDARTFQGKERDIMFLSMVVSPGDAQAQTKEATAQRFNVAASRARDRMYLVRSIDLDQLSPNDKLRRNLITHFSTPFMQDEKRVESLRDKCESDFEREVYDILVQRGYRVVPQLKVAEYRIDMVVEGHNDARLAIECDGDRYHGADKWEDDMHRQRVLERVGWQFWRCFASTFVRNRKDVIEDLIFTLAQRGIEPIGSETAPRSFHTEQRRVTAFPVTPEPEPEPESELQIATA